ncbi:hypothetical protein DMUE_3098 [Dictyocoela muelleri]|nr:hypothetical protein DMUE_3098 [Dictyocoela muelleri]
MDLLLFSNIEISPSPILNILKTNEFIAIIRKSSIEFLNLNFAEFYRIKIKEKINCSITVNSDIYIGSTNKLYKIKNFNLEVFEIDGNVVDLGFDGELILTIFRNGKYFCRDLVSKDFIHVFSNNKNMAAFGIDDKVIMNDNSLIVGKISCGHLSTHTDSNFKISNLLFIGTEDGKVIVIDILNFIIQQIIEIRESPIKSILYFNGIDNKLFNSGICDYNNNYNMDDHINNGELSKQKYKNKSIECILVSGKDSRLACLKKLKNQFLKSFQIDTHYSEMNSMIEVNNEIYTVGDDGYLNIHFIKDTHFIYRRIYSRPLIKIKYGIIVFVENEFFKIYFLGSEWDNNVYMHNDKTNESIVNSLSQNKPSINFINDDHKKKNHIILNILFKEVYVGNDIIDFDISKDFIVYSTIDKTESIRINDLSSTMIRDSSNKIYEESGFFLLIRGLKCFVYEPSNSLEEKATPVNILNNSYDKDKSEFVSNNRFSAHKVLSLKISFDINVPLISSPDKLLEYFSFHAKINISSNLHKFIVVHKEQFSILMQTNLNQSSYSFDSQINANDSQFIKNSSSGEYQCIKNKTQEKKLLNQNQLLDSNKHAATELCKVRGHVFQIEKNDNIIFLLTFTKIYQYNIESKKITEVFIGNINYGMGIVDKKLVLIFDDINNFKRKLKESAKERKFMHK